MSVSDREYKHVIWDLPYCMTVNFHLHVHTHAMRRWTQIRVFEQEDVELEDAVSSDLICIDDGRVTRNNGETGGLLGWSHRPGFGVPALVGRGRWNALGHHGNH